VSSVVTAFLLRFDFAIPIDIQPLMFSAVALALVVKMPVFLLARLDRGSSRFVRIPDLWRVLIANGVASAVFSGLVMRLLGSASFPWSVCLIDFLVCFVATGGARFAVRTYTKAVRPRRAEMTTHESSGAAPASPQCSFCHTPKDEVFKLITGQGAWICDECVDGCNDIIADAKRKAGYLPPLRPQRQMNATLKSLLFWVVLVVIGVLIYNVSTKFQQHDSSMTFSEFVAAANSGNVGRVTITGQDITGVTRSNQTFHTYAPAQYEGLVNDLIAHDVVVDVKEQIASPWATLLYTWAPAVLMIGFWIFFMRQFTWSRASELGELFWRFDRLEKRLGRATATLEAGVTK
jgi:hypothetical protein